MQGGRYVTVASKTRIRIISFIVVQPAGIYQNGRLLSGNGFFDHGQVVEYSSAFRMLDLEIALLHLDRPFREWAILGIPFGNSAVHVKSVLDA